MNSHNNQRQEINTPKSHLPAERNITTRTPTISSSLPQAAQTRHQPQEQRISPQVGPRTQPLATGFQTASLGRVSPIRPVLCPVQPESPFTFSKPENGCVTPSRSGGQPTQASKLQPQPQPQNSKLQRCEKEPHQHCPNGPAQERGCPSPAKSSRPTRPDNPSTGSPQVEDRAAAERERTKQGLRAEFFFRYSAETNRLRMRRNQSFWWILLLAGTILLMVAYYDSSLTPKTKPYCDDNNTSDTCNSCPQNSNCSRGRVVSCRGDYDLHAGFCIHYQADAQQTLRQVQAAVLMLAEQKGRLTCEDSVFHPSSTQANMRGFLAKFRTGERFELNRAQALTILMAHPTIQYDTEYEYQSRNIKYTLECFKTMFMDEFKVPLFLIIFVMVVLALVIYGDNAKVSKRENAQHMYSFLENEVMIATRPISEHTLRHMLFEKFGLSFQEVNNMWPEILVHAEGNRRLKNILGAQFKHPVRCWVAS